MPILLGLLGLEQKWRLDRLANLEAERRAAKLPETAHKQESKLSRYLERELLVAYNDLLAALLSHKTDSADKKKQFVARVS
jgi:hypothetical protein